MKYFHLDQNCILKGLKAHHLRNNLRKKYFAKAILVLIRFKIFELIKV